MRGILVGAAIVIEAALLGTGGMLPLPNRWLSSLLIRVKGQLTLFDCGEGTQIAWLKVGWSFRRLGAICVSHTHADHIAGLPGLLHAVANAGRVEPVDLFGPHGTADVVRGLLTIAPVLPFSLRVTELQSGQRFSLPGGLDASCEAGEHALPVLAFRADLRRGRAFLPDRAKDLDVPVHLWQALQRGETVTWNGRDVPADDVLGPAREGLAVAYVTDTRPLPALVRFAAGVDLLVCEGTYGSDDDQVKAERNAHMTFREAAVLARDANAKQLWISHFSPALEDPEAYAANATNVFPAATIGRDGLLAQLAFGDE
jgi:ribonuclease Z